MQEFFADDTADAMEFSVELQDMLAYDYDELERDDPAANAILQEETPEICDEVEPNDPREPFLTKLRKEYERALAASEAVKK